MTTQLTYLMLTLSLTGLVPLSAQSNDANTAENAHLDIDTSWQVDSSFGEQLVINSYEELLEVYFEAVVEVDKRLNFNVYRYHPGNTETVNPFVYDDIVLPESTLSNLENYESGFLPRSTFANNADEVLFESRSHIAQTNPELITVTWDQLPDPPKTEKYVGIMHNVDLDLSKIDQESRKIARPEKMEKQRYVYAPWQVKVVAALAVSQTSYSNWAKGGSNSFSLSGRIVADADYMSYDKKTRWQNDIESRLGYVQQEHKPFVKNLDFFRINTQYARNAFNKWFYAMNAEFTTQFFEGYDIKKDNYDDPISAFLSPAYLKVAIGLDYKYGTKTNKKLFSMQASPLSYKLTYVKDTAEINQKKYGIDLDKKNRQEIGGSVQFMAEYSYKKKIDGRSRLLFFSNYMNNPQNIDINWNTSITYQISQIFAINFTLDMIYDDDVAILLSESEDGTKTYGQRLQVKEFLGFGLTYRLM